VQNERLLDRRTIVLLQIEDKILRHAASVPEKESKESSEHLPTTDMDAIDADHSLVGKSQQILYKSIYPI
jgi:hypothetical protein